MPDTVTHLLPHNHLRDATQCESALQNCVLWAASCASTALRCVRTCVSKEQLARRWPNLGCAQLTCHTWDGSKGRGGSSRGSTVGQGLRCGGGKRRTLWGATRTGPECPVKSATCVRLSPATSKTLTTRSLLHVARRWCEGGAGRDCQRGTAQERRAPSHRLQRGTHSAIVVQLCVVDHVRMACVKGDAASSRHGGQARSSTGLGCQSQQGAAACFPRDTHTHE